MFTPFSLLGIWLRGLLALAIVGGASYLVYRWYDELPRSETVVVRTEPPETQSRALHSFPERLAAWRPGLDKPTAFLASAVVLFALTFGGRFLISPRWLRSPGADEPKELRTGEVRRVKRPDGTELRVEIYGRADAPPLVFTHGWGCDSNAWYYAKRRLTDHYRVIVWDLPGSGLSTRPDNNDYSLEKMAHDLKAVLDLVEMPAVLVGHSIGGMINLTFCRQFPQALGTQVSGIVIVHSTYTNPLRTMALARLFTLLQKPVIEPLAHLAIWLSPLVWLMNWMSYINGSTHWSTAWQSFAGSETRGQLDFAARYILQNSPAVMARGTLGMLRYDATDTLPEIDLPVLVIAGDRDPVTKPSASEVIAQRVKQGQLIELAPAKHLGLLEHHDELTAHIHQFSQEAFAAGQEVSGTDSTAGR